MQALASAGAARRRGAGQLEELHFSPGWWCGSGAGEVVACWVGLQVEEQGVQMHSVWDVREKGREE